MTQLLAWVWVPFLVFGLALGLGLLVDRALHTDLPGALLAPVGLVVSVLLASLGHRARLPVVVPPVLVVGALGGLLFQRGEIRRALTPVPLVTAGLVYLLYLAPVILTGTATWLGYNFVNDTASNFLLIDLLESGGAKAPTGKTGGANIGGYLVSVGYPLGSFSLVAGVRPLSGVPLESIYQPMIAITAAIGAISLTEIARRAKLHPAATVLASTLPFGGVLLYRYALHGAIKEVMLIALLLTSVAVGSLAVERRLPVRLVILLVLTAMAMVLVFSSAAGLFALSLGAAVLIAAAAMPERPSLKHVARLVGITLGLGLIVLIPVLGSVLDFTQNIRTVFDSSTGATTGEFGQLVRALPVAEGAGVWVSRDYRYPADGPLNQPLVAIAVLATTAGLITCVVRRWFAPLILVGTTLVPVMVISWVASPYIDAKMLVIFTPVVVFLGSIGALAAIQDPRRVVKLVGAAVLTCVVAGVLLSDLYAYRDSRPAPLDRVEAMKDVAAHADGRGLYLLNEWEEYGKVFMDAARINPASEAESPRSVALRSDVRLRASSPKRTPIFGSWFDLDLQTLDYVTGFQGVIMRRSPAASRPPANFSLVHRNEYYELWRRNRAVRVREHLPLQSRDRAAVVPDCGRVRALARGARPGDRLVAAARPRAARLSPLQVELPPGWPISGEVKGSVTTASPGVLRGTLTAAGRQRVWVRATASRALTVYVDGRRVGRAKQINTPNQWIEVGTIDVRPGPHRVEIRRAGASWRPGDSVYGTLGPLVLEGTGASRLVSLPPARAGELCGRSWDWIERVGGR